MEDKIDYHRFMESMFCGWCYDNRIEGYRRYENVYNYLEHQLLEQHKVGVSLHTACGYKSPRRFHHKMRDWLTLRDPIPMKFLKALKVDMDILETTLNLDRKEFQRIVEKRPVPAVFVICRSPIAPQTCKIPPSETEEEAIEYVRKVAVTHKIPCLIECPEIKTIWCDPEGKVRSTLFPPSMKVTARHVRFSFLRE
ncbi:MAG: hypothetical protein RDV48_10945 [Candidatus Eremiobacteraeota bacterium]|nr:hypothetical protein [Candidatus Eremiobacteraeota bacterium]